MSKHDLVSRLNIKYIIIKLNSLATVVIFKMSLERNLAFYERDCSLANINLMIQIETPCLTKDLLNDAFKLLKTKHPYMRMKIVKNEGSTDQMMNLKFVEQSEDEIKMTPIESFILENENDLLSWNERLIKIGNGERKHDESVVYVELYSLKNSDIHQIYFCVNHAGIDGPGMFTVSKDLLYFLDCILTNSPAKYNERKFIDLHKSYNPTFELNTLSSDLIDTENILNGVTLNPEAEKSKSVPIISANFFQFDENTTLNLIKNCKNYRTTIQGVVSMAALIALLDSKDYDVSNNVKAYQGVPCNMRQFVNPKLDSDDLVCGSALLTWMQIVDGQKSLWDLANEATKNIHTKRDENEGIRWWLKLKNSIPTQPYAIMSSSIGVIDINDNYLNRIKFNDIRILGSAYNVSAAWPGCMTHVFTCKSKLTIVFSYTYPALSNEWAARFADVEQKVLRYYADHRYEEDKLLKDFLKELKE